jgi:hypothetical protein
LSIWPSSIAQFKQSAVVAIDHPCTANLQHSVCLCIRVQIIQKIPRSGGGAVLHFEVQISKGDAIA